MRRIRRAAIVLLVSSLVGLSAFAVGSTARADKLPFSRALGLARERAPELREAKAQLSSSEAQVSLARAGYYPTLTAIGTGGESGSNDQAPIIPPRTTAIKSVTYTTAGTAAGTLRWTFLDFGRTANAVDSAAAARESSVASVFDADAALVSTVANAYLDVVYDEKIRDLERSIVEERDKSVQIVKGLVKQGLGAPVDELRAHARVEAARRDLEAAEAQLAEVRIGLLALLGLDTTSTPTVSAPQLPRPNFDVGSATKEADAKLPAVAVARYNLASEEAGVSAARARYYPFISLNGDASYRYARVDVFDQWLPTKMASASLVLTIPMYDPTIGARLDLAKSEVVRASATYDRVRRDSSAEATKSVVALAMSARVLEQAKKTAESSAAVLTIIRARFLQGLSSMLDLIEAETSDADARIAAVKSERSLDSATIRLFTATGRTARLYDVP